MKKTVSVLAAIVAVACVSFTSCNKSTSEDPTPTTSKGTAEYRVAVFDGQSDYFDQSYKITVNGKSSSFTVAQMTQVPNTSKKDSSYFNTIDGALEVAGCKMPYKLYSFALGSVEEGQKVTIERTCTPKTSRPKTAEIDILDSYGLTIFGKKIIDNFDAVVFGGVSNTDKDLDTFCKLRTKTFEITY